jgi:hypothetical protein
VSHKQKIKQKIELTIYQKAAKFHAKDGDDFTDFFSLIWSVKK